jgi:hypothetical protein
MEGARAPKFRPYWIRYLVAFKAGEKLKWARDNVLIACLCSLAPGLIAGGISATLSDHKWRAAAYATLLTYGGLFALFLMWRLVATPFELDRENRRFINGLNNRLALARLRVAALQARPPALEVEITRDSCSSGGNRTPSPRFRHCGELRHFSKGETNAHGNAAD